MPEHKPPTPGKGEKPSPHDHYPGRLLLESTSTDGKPPPKGEKPPPKHKPPTPLDKEEKPFPEHKPPKGKGEKPPPEHKPPHDHHPGHLLLESSSIDGKVPPKGAKPPPKHKPPTSVEEGEKKPFPEHKPPKGKGEKPPPEHKPPKGKGEKPCAMNASKHKPPK
ncbi:hypothetical protein CMV_027628, partial [Castanea mollissima]